MDEKKNILIIGGGGREHAIAWKLSLSKMVGDIYAIPGNAGMAGFCECHRDISASDTEKILEFLAAHGDIYMTVVAPDDPLSKGLVDILEFNGFRAFGPRKAAAEIESSKVFSKNLMKKYSIPTAEFETFSDYASAAAYLERCKMPIVIKADGLALGKGVIIANTKDKARQGLKSIMIDGAFGLSGKSVVIEEFLEGFEVSVLAFTDGKTIVPMVSSQDHKRIFDGDKGANTGGMGTFSPSRRYSYELSKKASKAVFLPTLNALAAENREFRGVLYFGLMIDKKGDIKVLEYNARFGDPETQVILPRLETDLLDIFDACIDGTLDKIKFSWSPKSCVCVVLASEGYPGSAVTGREIKLGDIDPGIMLFFAGAALSEDGRLVTSGGRVLGVTAMGSNLCEAKSAAYKAVEQIAFEGMQYRKDICKQGN